MQAATTSITTLFQALADPARLAIVERLSLRPCSVGELAAPLPMSLAAALQHVQVLEKSGLVVTEKVGRTRMCRLSPEALAPLHNWLAERRAFWERQFDQLEQVLNAQPDAPHPGDRSHDDSLPQLRRARHHPQFRKAAQRRV